jgi:hypothetical protein
MDLVKDLVLGSEKELAAPATDFRQALLFAPEMPLNLSIITQPLLDTSVLSARGRVSQQVIYKDWLKEELTETFLRRFRAANATLNITKELSTVSSSQP